ncbi:hypothetical protein [Streptomyces sp. NPDC006368]|uniref:hypothetical protein n=1 Tax=Streptomyces sp. NPDC006368 TaxID=3156760 RepID=UPI0033BE9496
MPTPKPSRRNGARRLGDGLPLAGGARTGGAPIAGGRTGGLLLLTAGGFATAFTGCAVAGAVGASVALVLVPRGKPHLDGVHAH